MRHGEVLGLRGQDIDVNARLIRLRQQVQRIQGELHIGPVKTRARNRHLPLIGLAQDALSARAPRKWSQWSQRTGSGSLCWSAMSASLNLPDQRTAAAPDHQQAPTELNRQ